jgi:lipoprotein-anchoring transpeptidase ErfK/SrfK
MPARSRYYHRPIRAWVLRTADGGRFGKVAVPYSARHRAGWIELRGLTRSTTDVRVAADLSEHRIVVRRAGRVVLRLRAATGAPSTPTPSGDYFITDRVAFPATSAYGAFAFGISGVQPRLPAGWSGGDQLAIHGTNDPSSIGRSVSAGCLRVSKWGLRRLKPLLRRGTPVVISP